MPAAVTSGLITIGNGAEATAAALTYLPAFYQRVTHIAIMVAFAVLAEDPTTTGNANRVSKASVWLAQSSDIGAQVRMAQAVLADLSITETSTSQAIADRLASIWDLIAGN
ncbi:hypothetical protein P12x_003044 [Tundrisphaera lichenicola]|uniref:hypothetical protein n=1 Tax=Tundrisphaera lichenicola TaxID=2029860 RepID=UPI003EB71B47